MDAFSEVLSAVHMTGAIFLDAEFTAPWGVSVPQAGRVAAVLAPAVEHIVSYHLVIEGEMLVEYRGRGSAAAIRRRHRDHAVRRRAPPLGWSRPKVYR